MRFFSDDTNIILLVSLVNGNQMTFHSATDLLLTFIVLLEVSKAWSHTFLLNSELKTKVSSGVIESKSQAIKCLLRNLWVDMICLGLISLIPLIVFYL